MAAARREAGLIEDAGLDASVASRCDNIGGPAVRVKLGDRGLVADVRASPKSGRRQAAYCDKLDLMETRALDEVDR